MLNVAAGNGNAALAAARRWCDVTSTDYVPTLVEGGRLRAEAEGQTVTFQEAHAENLPFEGRQLRRNHVHLGVVFTPSRERAASEMLRVCKPSGKIGLANWTPTGLIGQVFKCMGSQLSASGGFEAASSLGHRGAAEGVIR